MRPSLGLGLGKTYTRAANHPFIYLIYALRRCINGGAKAELRRQSWGQKWGGVWRAGGWRGKGAAAGRGIYIVRGGPPQTPDAMKAAKMGDTDPRMTTTQKINANVPKVLYCYPLALHLRATP